ncbi:MAG: hypothetical protein COS36_06395, partial [Candidatus Altarchaeum sp. CG03_land_8_20_14_0_80_32_618]
RQEVKKFENNHNKLQQWKLKNKNLKNILSRKLDKNFQFNPKRFEINTCGIHFIREIKNNGKIEMLNEEIMIDKGYVGERVWVTIDVVKHFLIVFYKAKDGKKFKQVKKMKYEVKNL